MRLHFIFNVPSISFPSSQAHRHKMRLRENRDYFPKRAMLFFKKVPQFYPANDQAQSQYLKVIPCVSSGFPDWDVFCLTDKVCRVLSTIIGHVSTTDEAGPPNFNTSPKWMLW